MKTNVICNKCGGYDRSFPVEWSGDVTGIVYCECKKLRPITGSGTCIAELQSKINELVSEVNKLKEKASYTVSSSGH